MKRSLLSLSIALILTQSTLAQSPDCQQELKRLQEASQAFAQSPAFYLEYTCTNSFNGEANEPILAKYWKEGDKFQFHSEPIQIYGDGKTLVRVLEPIEVVVVQNLPQKKEAQPTAVDPQAGMDAWKQNACAISCTKAGKNGRISLDFLPQPGKALPYRSVVIQYSLPDGNITQADYEYFPDEDGVIQRDTYIFQKRTATRIPGMYAGTAADQVMAGQGLKPRFAQYELQDLRALASNTSTK